MNMTTLSVNQFPEKFNADSYAHAYYASLKSNEPFLRVLHEFFSSIDNGSGLKVLDFAAGPVIAFSISSSAHANEIILADYIENNRRALKSWLSKDPKAYDWRPYFEFVVKDLESKDDAAVLEREEMVRNKVKAVVKCDVNNENILEEGYEGPYDAICSVAGLDSASDTKEKYAENVKKLTALLKPGGHILLGIYERPPSSKKAVYKVGEETFHALIVEEEFITLCLENANMLDIQSKKVAYGGDDYCNSNNLICHIARKGV